MEQTWTTSGTATTTVYVSNLEEVTTNAAGTSTTTYYYAAGQRLGLAANGVFSYLGNDVLGSADEALSAAGSEQASVLYDPYGQTRYSSGTMPGSYGFTGQHRDGPGGLDDYNARYYDASAGQFASADSVAAGGLSRYGYVGGNPETATDPTGHMRSGCIEEDGNFICPPNPPPPPPTSPPPPPTCTSNCNPNPPGGGGGCGGNPHACAGKGGGGGCARACMVAAITSRILYLTEVAQFFVDVREFLDSAIFFAWDVGELIGEGGLNVLDWVNIIVDGYTLFSSLVALAKDFSVICECTSTLFKEVIITFGAVLQIWATIANVLRVGAAFLWWINPGAILRKAGRFLEGQMKSFFKALASGVTQGLASGASVPISQLQLTLTELPNMSDDKLQQTCQWLGANCT